MKKNLLMMLTCGRAAILTCGLTVTLLSACSSDNDKTETPQEQADVQMMYAVEVTDDVLKVASVEVNYVDQTGAKQKEVMTSTTWKKTLNAKTLPLTEGLWAKLTPKGAVASGDYFVRVTTSATYEAKLANGQTITGGFGTDPTASLSLVQTPERVAAWCATSPTVGFAVDKDGYAAKTSVDFGGNSNNDGDVVDLSMIASSYRMASAATPEDLGKQICAAGHIHPAGGDAGCTETRVAKIVYVGNETGEESFGFTHGLALALSDANDGQAFKWRREVHPGRTSHKYYTDRSNFAIESGLQYNANHNSGDYPAFQAAIANNGTPAPKGCSSWFLASGYQWQKMIDASGLNNLDLDKEWNSPYWSSTECDPRNAWYFFSVYGGWFSDHENNDTQVRSCCAF